MSKASIPVSKTTRNLVKRKKRGGETYDELIRAVFREYNPDEGDE